MTDELSCCRKKTKKPKCTAYLQGKKKQNSSSMPEIHSWQRRTDLARRPRAAGRTAAAGLPVEQQAVCDILLAVPRLDSQVEVGLRRGSASEPLTGPTLTLNPNHVEDVCESPGCHFLQVRGLGGWLRRSHSQPVRTEHPSAVAPCVCLCCGGFWHTPGIAAHLWANCVTPLHCGLVQVLLTTL